MTTRHAPAPVSSRAFRATRRPRTGGIYVVVLGMTTLVSVVALGGLYAARVQCVGASAACDFATARLCARGGVEMAMYKIASDPTWRTDLGNGTWFSNVALGGGRYSVAASDPVSGDVTLNTNHPVVLTATGAAGAASYQLQVTVYTNADCLSCVNVSACSGGDTKLSHCTLTGNQTVSSGGNFAPDPASTVNANCECVNTFNAGTYNGAKTPLAAARTLPDPVHVFDYYKANGAAVPYTSLLKSNQTALVANGSFETNTAGWYVYSSNPAAGLSLDKSQHKDGASSLLTSGRSSANDVPATDLPLGLMRSGDTYQIQMPVYAASTGTVQAALVLVSDGGTQTFTTPAVNLVAKGGWANNQGSVTASWTGVLRKATLTLVCSDGACNLDIDAVGVTDSSLPSSAYVLDRVVLSPTQNPFGSTNPQGVYVLDCNNQNVTVGPCRIVGTLVMVNVGSGSTIQGPIAVEPAVAGYPALLADGALNVSFDAGVALSEATLGVNFNPAGTPYPFLTGTGGANATAADAYPSVINGLFYCGGNLTLSTAPLFNGCVVAAGTLQMNATSANFTYNNASYIAPPPGFSTGVAALKPVPGSWQRVTHN